jgi:hypothetical protein
MLGRSLHVVATLGVLILITGAVLGTVWYALPQEPRIPSQQADESPPENYLAGGAVCDPKRLNVLSADKAPAERDRCTEAAEDHRIREAELAQQRRANDLAEWNLRLTARQARSGFLQTVATVLAFIAAAVAAVFAGIAVRHAGASAKADNLALRATRRANKEARVEAAEQAKRFTDQLHLMADNASAAREAARSTHDMASSMGVSAKAAGAAVEAASIQLELARKSFIADQRPWVGVDGLSLHSLEIDELGAKLKLTMHLRNSGRTPAHRLGIKARLFAEQRPLATVEDIKNRFAARPRLADPDDAVACIFPGQQYESDFSVPCARKMIDEFPIIGTERQLLFTLAGFVFYESDVSGVADIHATSFIYRIFSPEDSHIMLSTHETFLKLDGDGIQLKSRAWPHGWLAD